MTVRAIDRYTSPTELTQGVHADSLITRTPVARRHLRASLVGSAALVAALSGCLSGEVRDASTQEPLDGVQVFAVGYCGGVGCDHPQYAVQVTAADIGAYVFDAYGDVHGAENVQFVAPAVGRETLSLWFTKSGYDARVMAVKPQYETYEYYGKEYLSARAPSMQLCRQGAPDTDGDGICDDAELGYGTDPLLSDSDGDGFSDRMELFGVISDDLDMIALGASATHTDVFVYLDYYRSPPLPGALARVQKAFADAPVSNPDGISGINLHFIVGEQIALADREMDIVSWSQLDGIKLKYFPSKLARVAHYALIANRTGGAKGYSGMSRGLPSHDFIVSLRRDGTSEGSEIQQAGTLMHELGHNLGLGHGGNDRMNYKPNYLSVMNYNYQMRGLYRVDTQEHDVLDYSRFEIAAMDESSVVETAGMTPIFPTTREMLKRYTVKRPGYIPGPGQELAGSCAGPLDFDGDGNFSSSPKHINLDGLGSSLTVFPPSQNDWTSLRFGGLAAHGGEIGDTVTTSSSLRSVGPRIVSPDDMAPELQ